MFYMKRTSKSKETSADNEPKAKKLKLSVPLKTIKPIERKITVFSVPKIKLPTSKTKAIVSPEKKRTQTQKIVPTVLAQKTKAVKTKEPTTVPVRSVEPSIKKAKPAIVKTKNNSVKPQSIVSAKKTKSAEIKLKAVENKVQKPKAARAIKTKSPEIKPTTSKAKTAPPENKIKPQTEKLSRRPKSTIIAKAIENKIEPVKPAIVRKPKKKRAKPISSAVFRGKKELYGFEVFPLDAELEDVSAIYVISKRKIDNRKKGHHAVVCIGQTESVLGEIKRHKKGKCVKNHQANVISILPEENEKKRLRIETDLKAAHAVSCRLE